MIVQALTIKAKFAQKLSSASVKISIVHIKVSLLEIWKEDVVVIVL